MSSDYLDVINWCKIGYSRLEELDTQMNTSNYSRNSDLDIADDKGNVLVRIADGHIKTKHFDSSELGINTTVSEHSDLDIADDKGNVLARIADGHIKTKYFDSSSLKAYRPYKRETNFIIQNIIANQPQNTNLSPIDINSSTDYRVVSDFGVLYLPVSYTSEGDPTKLIIFCKHGGSFIDLSNNPIFSIRIFDYLLYLGYAVLAVDGVPDELTDRLDNTRVVGNYMAVQSTKLAYDRVTSYYNIDKNGTYIFGFSQGGHFAQNVIDLSGIPFLACAEISPVCSMQYHQWNLTSSVNVGGVTWTKPARLNIARLFGFNDIRNNDELLSLNFDDNKVNGYDPWTRNVVEPYRGFVKNGNLYKLAEGTLLDQISMKKIISCPLKIWCAENDSALGVDVMKVFIKACKNAGQVADICVYSSGGHELYNHQNSIGSFVENGQTKQLYPIAKEVAAWFSTFGGYSLK